MSASPIVDLTAEWPFPEANDRTRWHEISEKDADELLGCVPPAYFPGGFYVGEAASHDADGCAVHAAVVQVGGRHYLREMRAEKATRERLVSELHATLNPAVCPFTWHGHRCGLAPGHDGGHVNGGAVTP